MSGLSSRHVVCRSCGRTWRAFSACPWCGERIGAPPPPWRAPREQVAREARRLSVILSAAALAASCAAMAAALAPEKFLRVGAALRPLFPAALPALCAAMFAIAAPVPPPLPPAGSAWRRARAQWGRAGATLAASAAAAAAIAAALPRGGAATACASFAAAWPFFIFERCGPVVPCAAAAMAAVAAGPGGAADFALASSAAATVFAVAARVFESSGPTGPAPASRPDRRDARGQES